MSSIVVVLIFFILVQWTSSIFWCFWYFSVCVICFL